MKGKSHMTLNELITATDLIETVLNVIDQEGEKVEINFYSDNDYKVLDIFGSPEPYTLNVRIEK